MNVVRRMYDVDLDQKMDLEFELDQEWVALIQEAREIGISAEQIKCFLRQSSTPK